MRSWTTGICCALLAIAVFEAKRSGSRPNHPAAGLASMTAAGTLFLRPVNNPHRLWTVDVVQGARPLPEGVDGEPSRALHNGARWFLTTKQFVDETYADGLPRRELCIVDEDGRVVQLTNSPDLEPLPLVGRWPLHGNDLIVSFVARRWDASGRVVEGGIYTARLKLDAQGEVSGLLAQPDTPCIRLPMVADSAGTGGGQLVPNVSGYDWSPDGEHVVCESIDQSLQIITLATGLKQKLTSIRGCDPSWSPDGETIAFKIMEPFGAIASIRPDGSDLKRMAYGQRGDHIVFSPTFSPGGSQIAHARMDQVSGSNSVAADGVSACMCMPAAGPAVHWLKNVPAGLVPVAWRSDS